jgi:quinol monooxygenase YgiN
MREVAMTAYNVVRFRVKAGREKEFVDAHKNTKMEETGFRKATLIKTGERTYCFVGEWDSQDAIVAARPKMIGILDGLRGMLEDLGGGLGVSDAVSGPAVIEIKPGH